MVRQIDLSSQNPRMQCSVCGRWMRLHGKRLELIDGHITEVAVQRFYGGCNHTRGDHLAGDGANVCTVCCDTECKRLAALCDCQAPDVKSGAALVSEACPIHNLLSQPDEETQRYLAGNK